MGYYFYDMTGYFLVIIGTIITLAADFYVRNRYNKYSNINNENKLSGCEVARKILDENGLNDIYVTEVKGVMTDHYDPTRKVVRLSTNVFHGSTIASTSIAAHECGHAIQHKEGYFFIKLRGWMVPLVNFSSKAGYIAIMIGLIFGFTNLAWAGIGLELVILAFQLVTLPTEFDASKRAKIILEKDGILNRDEVEESTDMLRSAALTYVAGVANTLLQVLRLIMIVGGRDD